jgi:hypothetical protein
MSAVGVRFPFELPPILVNGTIDSCVDFVAGRRRVPSSAGGGIFCARESAIPAADEPVLAGT